MIGWIDDHQSPAHSSSDEEHARVARERISRHTICLICGGAGHTGYVDGLGQCLSARLNNRIPGEDLAQFRYPSGYRTAPRFRFNNSNSHPSTSNSNPNHARTSNQTPSRPRTRQFARETSRVTEPPPSEESSGEDVSRTQSRGRTLNRTNNRTRTRSASFRHNARHVEEETMNEQRDDTQNVERNAENEDHDEHEVLRVDFDEIIF